MECTQPYFHQIHDIQQPGAPNENSPSHDITIITLKQANIQQQKKVKSVLIRKLTQ